MPSRTCSRPEGHARRVTTCSQSGRSSRARTSPGSQPPSNGELRVVGARGWGNVEPPANVTWLGEVGDDELASLYRGARCLVYASLYEGFGIPVAEALACGCPVVTTAGSPMAELAGGDAVYVDPTDTASIRDGIARAAAAPPRRGATWADVARLTTEVYAEVA